MRIVIVAAVLLFAGCQKDNPFYGDGAVRCSESSAGCVCLKPEGICVQCTAEEKQSCTGATPACGDDHMCRGCIKDDECSSNVCLEDGTCADAVNVIYASATGAGAAGCGQQLGTNECSLAQAVMEVQGARNIIKLRPSTYGVTGLAGQDFQKPTVLVARGSTINRGGGGNGAILTVSGQALTLIGGTITGAVADDGVQCTANGALRIHEALITDNAESGIEVDACELTVSRSTISLNRGGGIFMSGVTPKPVNITNNFIHSNGLTSSPVGGLLLLPAGTSTVEFNTVVDNRAAQSSGVGGGIRCNTTGTFNFPNNLVYRNTGGIGNQVQVIGECTFLDSFQLADPTGSENVPMFVAPNAATPDYHLTPQTPLEIRDKVDCTGVDFDGQRRPINGKCDLGADELQR
ncbi:MAG TPA: right-handed parallel beta-helix repeat-containing protein [Kofleriaceae bacterium]|nr:right-handed parallel beta-helix repeat-containing protein [Kofleriaceae bacterium]